MAEQYSILSRSHQPQRYPRKWVIEHEGEFFQEGCSYMATRWEDLDHVRSLIVGLRTKWPTRTLHITKHDGSSHFEEIEG